MSKTLTEVNRDPEHGGKSHFTATLWTDIVGPAAEGRTEAVEKLCRAYWYPIYTFIRRKGWEKTDAEDLTQEFMAKMMSPEELARADRGKGRFRTYLLGALDHFLANERTKRSAMKRGGGMVKLSWEELHAEEHYQHEPRDNATPATMLDRAWARAVLDRVRERLQGKYASAGKADLFNDLQVFLDGVKGEVSYDQVAAKHRIPLNTLKSEIRRMRASYGELIHNIVAETVATPQEVDDEIAHLLSLSGE